jgi:hypothetical protein
MFCDSHHEDVTSYKVAKLLVEAINNSKWNIYLVL